MARHQSLPPDEQYLSALRAEGERAHADEDSQIDRMRQLRQLSLRVAIPDEIRLTDTEVRDPTVADEVQRVAATLSVNRPILQVRHAKITDKATANATLRERTTEAILWKAGSREGGPDTFTRLVDAVVGDGGGWTKLVFRKDRWDLRYRLKRKDFSDDPEDDDGAQTADEKYDEATEDAKREDVPFDWLCVDARTIYPFWDGARLAEVLEVQKRPLRQTFRQYRLAYAPDGEIVADDLGPAQGPSDDKTSSYADCFFLEHWNDTYVTYCVLAPSSGGMRSKVVQQWKHGYDRVPYFFAPGVWMNFWRNRKVGWGVSEAKRWLVENRSFLFTLIANVAARDSIPPLFRQLPDSAMPLVGADGQPQTDGGRWKLGTTYTGQPGEVMAPLQFPPIAQSIEKYLALTSDAIDKLETPRIRSEIGGGLEGAGFAVNTVLTEARVRHDPLCQSIERCMGEITRFLWEMIRTKVRERVWVYQEAGLGGGWLAISPDDLKEGVSIEWKLDPMLPASKLIEDRMWHDRLQAGTASLDEVIDASGRNPDEVRQGRAMDEFRQTPAYKKMQQAAILAEAARGDLFANAQEQQVAETVAETGGVPGAADQAGGMGAGGIPGDTARMSVAPNAPAGAPGGMPPMVGLPGTGVPPQQGQMAAMGALQG